MEDPMINPTLPKKMGRCLDDFTRMLVETYGDGLVSVILYGSAASDDFAKRHSNIDLAVILKDAGLDNLKRLRRVMNERRFRVFSPIFLTEGYLKDSSDVFPIELLDMRDNHRILYGTDPLTELAIDSRNLRFQCEHELRGKLIQLNRLYLRNRGGALKAALFRSFTSVAHVLRSVLRLKGISMVDSKEDVVRETGRLFGIETSSMKKILMAKNGKFRLSGKEAEGLFLDFADKLERIVAAVDKL
jgi:hypothetical protein